LTSVHCIAHRLALASGQAADKVPYLKKYQGIVNAIFKYFHFSAKHQSKLNKIQQIYNLSQIKMKQTFHTRWLSFEGAVDAILQNYDALVSCLEMDVAEGCDPTASGLLTFISDYQFLAVSHMLSDVLRVLGTLSRVFQTRDLDLSVMNFAINSATASIKGMKSTPGPNLQKFISSLPEDYVGGFEFGVEAISHRIKCPEKQVSSFENIKQQYLDKVVENLQQRFEDSGLIARFAVFNPANLPDTEEEMAGYGTTDVQQLADFYSDHKDPTSPLCVEANQLLAEWVTFKFVLHKKYRGQTFVQMASKVMTDSCLDHLFPCVKKMLKICMVMPVSSADCERGFSRYNLIKTQLRNRLKPESVNTLLKLTVDTPPVGEMDKFDFGRAFDNWVKMKRRKIIK